MNAKRIVAGLSRRLYAYMYSLYWSSVSVLYSWKIMWPNASAAQAEEVGRQEKASRKIFVMMHSGRLTDLYIKCFETARRHSPDSKIEFFTDLTEEERMKLKPYAVTFHDIRTKDYLRKSVVLKIEILRSLDFKYGDNVIVSDLDIVFQSDPFKVFKNDFDVFFTTRHYRYHFLINGGIWGFRVNERSRRFVRFFIRQMFARSWQSLREFGKRFGRDHYGPGWFLDQDFLCTVYENINSLPRKIMDVRFFDAGYRYNFCPSFDINGENAVQELKSKIGDPDYVVLHLKAQLKRILDVSELKKL